MSAFIIAKLTFCFRGADDRTAYVALLKELRLAFEGEAKSSGQPRLLLTAAVPASFEAIAAGYDVPEISKYLVKYYIKIQVYCIKNFIKISYKFK